MKQQWGAVRGFSLQTLTYLPLWFLLKLFFLTTTGQTSVLVGYKAVLCEAWSGCISSSCSVIEKSREDVKRERHAYRYTWNQKSIKFYRLLFFARRSFVRKITCLYATASSLKMFFCKHETSNQMFEMRCFTMFLTALCVIFYEILINVKRYCSKKVTMKREKHLPGSLRSLSTSERVSVD